ncbi:hypothetical protein JTB14_010094 [Gonioctena quinquepunctata]|nr:hypothetical protein JTB14_010094 [Gonioctena quinquepunctata]
MYRTPEHKISKEYYGIFPDEPIKDYEINRLLFGVSCSAFLAIVCISQLSADYNDLPLASEVLRNSVYVDDIILGHNSPQTILLMIAQLVELLSRAGFKARKWMSNDLEFLSD